MLGRNVASDEVMEGGGFSVPLVAGGGGRGGGGGGLDMGSEEGKGSGGGGLSVGHRVFVFSWCGTPVWLSTQTSMGDVLKHTENGLTTHLA